MTACRFGEDGACALDAVGNVVIIQGVVINSREHVSGNWPEGLTGAHCERHGKLVVARAPTLAPGVVLEWRPYPVAVTPPAPARKRVRKP